ncbi:MAG: TraR/DksA C4-type zinc finger protein [Pyrinomonadaceae bacterium]|nr:TraR/DksA C4-type zinc finger protein [Phycisphaerales bacterium]
MPSTSNKKATTKGKKDAPAKHAAPKKSPAALPRKKAGSEPQRKPAPAKASDSGKTQTTFKSTAKTTVVVKTPAAKVPVQAAQAKSSPSKSLPAKPAPTKSVPAKTSAAKPGKSTPPITPAPKAGNGKGTPAPTKDVRAAAPAPASNGSTAKPAVPAASDDKKAPAKGITVVQHKPMRKPKIKVKVTMPSDPLFKPGSKWKPLIPSGPNATPTGMANIHAHGHANDVKPVFKSKLTKKELEPYRKILLTKRSELVGDIAHMEDEALRQSSGSLSQLPQHMAEQGSDTFEQSLSLDLAAVDRSLIREIDDALKRIEDGTYGMCERTGKPINAVRLAELPWARYSIEAARELERRPYQE